MTIKLHKLDIKDTKKMMETVETLDSLIDEARKLFRKKVSSKTNPFLTSEYCEELQELVKKISKLKKSGEKDKEKRG